MNTIDSLRAALNQKEQALIQYVRYIREAHDSQNMEAASLFADLAKAEEKHIAVIRDQVANASESANMLNKYQDVNQFNSQNFSKPG